MSFTIAMIHVFPSIETPSSRIQRALEAPGIEGIIKPGAWTISGGALAAPPAPRRGTCGEGKRKRDLVGARN